MLFPSGTVTFLFTDIEGSTRLAREHADRWDRLRSRHHVILREAIEQNNGYVFQIIGDAFCAAFHIPADALHAAVQSQHKLHDEPWGETPVRVRMGIHTGEARFDGQDYNGYLTLSMVQRLMSAGHGGQVLVSGATENLLRGQLTGEVYLQDMGRHHFKDTPQPVRVFQLKAPDLQEDFPPVRTVDHHPNNLPSQITSFVGREKEQAEIHRLLHNAHMLTLIGPGGTGKTRLSIQAASELLDSFPDGVWFVELAPILDPLLVPRTTAIAIGLRDEPQRPVIDMLCDYLRDKKILLLLDNCEHLVDACAHMADRILHAAPDVLILASSREALGIGGEVTYRVPSLGLPDIANLPPVETLDQYEAVRLFIDRATSADPSFVVTNENAPAVAQICHRLDGIPLAIELAAAKISVLSVDQIAKRLNDRFKLLTGGSRTALERHQTLRAAIDWSYNLLPPDEQILFRRLSIFVGGWTLEAAESVCSGGTITSDDILDLLDHLIHKSLVFREESRYRMLETIRQYANEKLVESGESSSLRDKHLEYFLILAEIAEPHLTHAEQLEWFVLLDMDYENFRLAFEWALSLDTAVPSLRLCTALGRFWHIQGRWVEGSHYLVKALEKPRHDQHDDERVAGVRALYWQACLAELLDDIERMESSSSLSLTLAQQGSDQRDTAIAMFYMGFANFRNLSLDAAKQYFDQCLSVFQKLGDLYWQSYTQYLLLGIHSHRGDTNNVEFSLQCLELARKSGDRYILARTLNDHFALLYVQDRIDEAKLYMNEVEEIRGQMMASGIRCFIFDYIQLQIGHIEWVMGNHQRARDLVMESQAHFQLIGEKQTNSWCLATAGFFSLEEKKVEQAKEYFEAAITTARECNDQYSVAVFKVLLSTPLYLQGKIEQARQAIRDSLPVCKDTTPSFQNNTLIKLLINPYFQVPPRSIPILAVTDRYQKELNIYADPASKHYCQEAEVTAREVLGDAGFEAAFAETRTLSMNEVIDLALKAVEEM